MPAYRGGRGVAALAGVLLLLALLAGWLPGEAVAQQEKTATFARFDPTLVVQTDGTFRITERMVVRFEGGPFRNGERTIPLARTGGIDSVALWEERADGLTLYARKYSSDEASIANTFVLAQQNDMLKVSWAFPTTYNRSHTFVLQYTVRDALRSYPDESPPNQQVWWALVGGPLTRETPVEQSTATIQLPKPVPLANIVLRTNGRIEPAATRTRDGQTFVWEHGAFARGEALEAQLQVPPLADVPVPAWQAADDQARASSRTDATQKAAIALQAALAVLIAVGGGVGGYLLWYLRGRDPVSPVVPSFLPKPPDDLPPGAAGALLDEQTDHRDVVATIVDLGYRGVLSITPTLYSSRQGLPDYVIRLQDKPPTTGALDAAVLRAVFGTEPKPGATTTLSALGQQYAAEFPAIRAAIDQELLTRGYFSQTPAATRRVWQAVAAGIGGIAVVAGAAAALAQQSFALLPAAAGLALAVACWRLAQAMPRKTQAGADAAAKWQAFRHYLDDIAQYERLSQAEHIFDSYLSYATAFGLDQRWISAFEKVCDPAPSPWWYAPGTGSDRDPDFSFGLHDDAGGSSWLGGGSFGGGGLGGFGHGLGTSGGGGSGLGSATAVARVRAANRASLLAAQSGSDGLGQFLSVAGTILGAAIVSGAGGGGGGGFH